MAGEGRSVTEKTKSDVYIFIYRYKLYLLLSDFCPAALKMNRTSTPIEKLLTLHVAALAPEEQLSGTSLEFAGRDCPVGSPYLIKVCSCPWFNH
jgi:hypothetical protein